jgi:hypothetical protein
MFYNSTQVASNTCLLLKDIEILVPFCSHIMLDCVHQFYYSVMVMDNTMAMLLGLMYYQRMALVDGVYSYPT